MNGCFKGEEQMIKGILWSCIFLMLLMGVYEFISYIRDVSLLSVTGQKILKKMSESEQKRLEKEKRSRMLQGNSSRKNLICRIDVLLLQSGVRRSFPFINTEMFLLLIICCALAAELICFWKQTSVLWLMFAPAIVCGGSFALLSFLSGRNYKKAEEQILPFMNLIGNYSYTEDDLISIFGRIAPYLEEPYRSAVEECYLYGKATGDAVTAFRELGLKIPHEQFQRLMRNLEICCQHEANYGEIIDDSREMLQDYLKNKKERDAVKKNARFELLILLGGCILALWMIDGLTERGILELLESTLPGRIMMLYCGGVLLACGKLYFTVDS